MDPLNLIKVSSLTQLQEFVEGTRTEAEQRPEQFCVSISKTFPINYKLLLVRILHLLKPEYQNEQDFDKLLAGTKNYVRAGLTKNLMISWLRDKQGNIWCPNCNRTFLTVERFKCHLSSSHLCKNNPETKVQCNFCKNFVQQSCMEDHLRTHTGEKPSKCTFCKKRFTGKPSLKIHVNTVHTKKKCYPCPICGKKDFYSATRRFRHIHGEHYKTKYTCTEDNCGAVFEKYSRLLTHRRMRHTFKEPVQCDICGKNYDTDEAYKLKWHRKTKHFPAAKKIKCGFCKKRFEKKSQLQLHLPKHTKEKTYKCQVCGACFGQPAGLFFHQKIHKNERKFGCDICDMHFNLKHHLGNHLKSKIHLDAQRLYDLVE